MQWILKSSTARSFERKWYPKIRPPYKHPEDLEDDIPLVFHKPSWQLRACLASVLITPVLYQLYLIMVTIRYILFLQTFSSPPRSACPVVDLSWTGVFPCELGWRGSALAVLTLSAVLITCYSLITACLVRWNPRKQWNIQYCTTSVFEKPTKFQVRVQSTDRLMLPPTLSLCILLLIFRLLLQSGDVEANPGPTFTSTILFDDLYSVHKNLIKAAGNWFDLGLYLGVRPEILNNIKSKHSDIQSNCLRNMLLACSKTGNLTYYKICQSLRAPKVGRNDVAEAIEEKFTGFKQHFEEAMKDGFVTLKTVNVILMGPAGSGKTSVKDLVLNNEVKEERNSTGALDRTIQVRSVASHHFMCKGKEWNEMTTQDLKSLLSRAISQYSLKGVDKKSSTSAAENIHDHSKAAVKGVNKKSSTSAAENIHDHSQAAVKAVVDDLEEISSIAVSTSVRHKSGKELFGTMTIRVTDSGGQPQFHDIAPLFTQGTSAGVYVMKLTDKFNDYPSDECYIGGQQVGTPSLSHLSHGETIRSLVQSLLSVNTHEKKPRCIFVGTFKDAFKDHPPSVLTATLAEKNKELRTLIPECFRVYSNTQMTQQILALNAISRDEDAQTIAHAIRNAVEGSPFFEDKVPLRWFALELSLQELCTKVGRRILTISECVSVAKKLQPDTDDVYSALEYFNKICIAHYYPQKLPGVVFVDPQVPLEIINDLVRYAMSLRGGDEVTLATATHMMDPKWKLFRDGGILTLDMLESEDFKKHFLVGIFVPKDMIELMKELLVITPLTNSLLGESANTSQFFMPALLKSIPQAELKNCCIHDDSVDPLLVRFTNGSIRAGVFCCLVVFLMKTCGWERYSKLCDQVPQARNCIKLKYRKVQCFVTLVDSITHIEVYVNAPEMVCEDLCPKIKEDISKGIRVSQEALHYSIDTPEFCFFCPCIYGDRAQAAVRSHHAEINVDYCIWNCFENLEECNGKPLKNKHLIWFEKKDPGGGEHSRSEHLTVDNIVREVGIMKEVLDQHCSSEVLEEIGRVLPKWLKYAKVLKLSEAQIQGIKSDANLDYEMKGQKVLEIWCNEYNTSYRMLVDICLKLKDGKTARRICEIVKESNPLKRKRKREDTKDDEDGECSASGAKKPCQLQN